MGRPTLTTLLLVVSLAVTAFLVIEAHAAALDHRAVVGQALRDFAALAGDELVRRAAAEIGYGGYARLLPELARHVGPGSPRSVARGGGPADGRLARARALVREVIQPGRNGFEGERGPLPNEVARLLAARLNGVASRPNDAPFVAINGVVAGEPRSFALAPAEGGGGSAGGFEADLPVMGAWIAEAAARAPLLPPALGRGRVGNDALTVIVRDQAGVERVRAGRGPWPEIQADVAFGSSYSGVLDGWTASVSVDPAAARELVIGGLPRSRLPLLLGLLALSTVLVATALLQLKRERALHQMRSEFVANVSHELRTPLTQIRMYAETLRLARVRSEEERQRALQILDREARRLEHLVANVLRFSRGERGPGGASRETLALAPFVRQIVEEFAPLAGPGVRLTLRLDPSAATRAEAGALRQVLLNLLDNAVRYGPPQQELTISAERAGDRVRFAVADQGPGVPAADRARVFERFYRLDREAGGGRAGTGIGLAVVRVLVESHDGRCFVEDAPGGGARFVVELPAVDRPAA